MSCLAQLSRPKLMHSTGARVLSNNTAEMSAIVEALSFLGPHGPVARDARSCMFSLIPSMLLVFAWAQFLLARTYSLDSPANSYC